MRGIGRDWHVAYQRDDQDVVMLRFTVAYQRDDQDVVMLRFTTDTLL